MSGDCDGVDPWDMNLKVRSVLEVMMVDVLGMADVKSMAVGVVSGL